MGVEAWYMQDDVKDQKAENRMEPNEAVGLDTLKKLGVEYYSFPVEVEYPVAKVPWEPEEGAPKDEKLAAFRKEQGMNYADIITINKEKLPDFDNKLKNFFTEHIHDDDEVRYIIEGSGYFDVRNVDDSRWVRILCKAGQCITLPKGIYHRFTLDSTEHAKAMRLFVGDPIWTPINRGEESEGHVARKHYLKNFIASQ
eukprot:TRINITY_DN6010_c0_g2_i1.p1 TRINITY_DN6010_c0_g2~~TRINITY_DN6010_c0_g2_i1.p1  ORF type:complete len:226 (+),score=63.27 TRINITY_DN6010_c0_g2_i1:85-678(+)